MSTFVPDVISQFNAALTTFLTSSAGVISGYVMPIGWVVLAIGLLVHAWAIMEGKVQAPLQDWLFKLIAALMVLYAMSGGYLNWIGIPLANLGSDLGILLAGGTDATSVLSNANDRIVELVTVIFRAAGLAMKGLDYGSAVLLVVFGILVGFACFLLIGTALFFIIFAQIGISLVIAVGPFFVLGLLNQHSRNYFFSWLNTALYFVFYQVLTILFISLFLSILEQYINALNVALSGVDYSIKNAVLNMIGMGTAKLNVVATLTPVIIISVAMFFMLLQLPTIASSMTSGSGGQFGNGLYAMARMGGVGGRGRTKGSGNGGSGQSSRPRNTARNASPSNRLTLPAPRK